MKLTLLLLLLSATLHATEFFVNKQGLDSNAGTSRAAAFLTIQRAWMLCSRETRSPSGAASMRKPSRGRGSAVRRR